MPVHCPVKDDQAALPTMMDYTRTMNDGLQFPWVDCMLASISLSPCLRYTRFIPSQLAGRRDRYPATRSQFKTVQAVMCLPKHIDISCLHPCFLWSGRPCCLLHHRALLTHPCVTLNLLVTSHTVNGNKIACRKTFASKFCGMIPPITCASKKEGRIQNAICNWPTISLGVIPKFKALGLFLFERASAFDTQTGSVEIHKLS